MMLLAVLLFLARPLPCTPFHPAARTIPRASDIRTSRILSSDQNEVDTSSSSASGVGKTKNPLELASWYAVEAFGKAFGSKNDNGNQAASGAIDITKPPSSLEETLKRIQLDNDRSYFLSGEVDRLIYDEDCTFADPFVSFDGRERFIENLSNLGSFITNFDAKMIKYDVEKEGREIITKVWLFFLVRMIVSSLKF